LNVVVIKKGLPRCNWHFRTHSARCLFWSEESSLPTPLLSLVSRPNAMLLQVKRRRVCLFTSELLDACHAAPSVLILDHGNVTARDVVHPAVQ